MVTSSSDTSSSSYYNGHNGATNCSGANDVRSNCVK